ncbi:hypothetical protein KC945_02805 [Candidatus Saccharibacteria bacterium]|nr:hypothetical protein [Candidatus Saccharibacteria bacterium]
MAHHDAENNAEIDTEIISGYSIYGDKLRFPLGNGETYREAARTSLGGDIVTPQELELLVQSCAGRDIGNSGITRPPHPAITLQAAKDFFDTYLYDTQVIRDETIQRYVAKLVELLEANHKDKTGKIVDYSYHVIEVRDLAQNELELAA